MKKAIYYFTGTGNSLRTARIIAAEIGGAALISMRSDPEQVPARDAEIIGFVCPVYEWDVPKAVREFVRRLAVNPRAYIFMVATYIAIHGGCFETVDAALREKGAGLCYGRALRCVASQCVAYEPFPPPRLMVPRMERKSAAIGREIAAGKLRRYPAASPLAKRLHPKMMRPFLEVQHEYDKGFYPSDACTGCGTCARVCPCRNITLAQGRPVWNHACEGCNACVVYCPAKAIQFRTPEAYARLDNPVSRRLGLPEGRTRYHNPRVTAADLMGDWEEIAPGRKGREPNLEGDGRHENL